MKSIKSIFEKFEKKQFTLIQLRLKREEFLDLEKDWNQLKSEIQEIVDKNNSNSMKRFVDYDVEISQLKKEIERLKKEERIENHSFCETMLNESREKNENLQEKIIDLKSQLKEQRKKIEDRIETLEKKKIEIKNEQKRIENTKCPSCGRKVTFGASGEGKIKYGCYDRECPRVKAYNYFYIEFWLPPLWEVEHKLEELESLKKEVK